MTDREKLLVSLFSEEAGDEEAPVDGSISSLEIVGMLSQLGLARLRSELLHPAHGGGTLISL